MLVMAVTCRDGRRDSSIRTRIRGTFSGREKHKEKTAVKKTRIKSRNRPHAIAKVLVSIHSRIIIKSLMINT
jgi:hypothetical protein